MIGGLCRYFSQPSIPRETQPTSLVIYSHCSWPPSVNISHRLWVDMRRDMNPRHARIAAKLDGHANMQGDNSITPQHHNKLGYRHRCRQ